MNRLKERFRRFMIGRYGLDQLGSFLNTVVLVLIILSIFFRRGLLSILLNTLVIVLLILLYARVFSKNFNRRYKENEAFMRLRFRVSESWKKWKFKWEESRKYRIFRCPNCRQKVRIPRGHGKVSIHCPKCGTDFIKRS